MVEGPKDVTNGDRALELRFLPSPVQVKTTLFDSILFCFFFVLATPSMKTPKGGRYVKNYLNKIELYNNDNNNNIDYAVIILHYYIIIIIILIL